MTFEEFVSVYERDVRPKLKENTWLSKEHVIQTKLLPYFKRKRMCDITSRDIGFLLLDSPKDKDLDDYRFEKYLELINMESNTSQGQIFITGSLSDKELYYNKLSNAHFFEELTTESKLLK